MNFDFNNNYVLEDDVVLLRPLEITDITLLSPFVEFEPELWKYSMVSVADIGMEKYISLALDARVNTKEYPFIVFDKRTGKYAGSTRFYDIQPTMDTVQLGYTWYGKDFQGTGLNKHCKFLMLSFAFEQMLVHRVEFRADNNNIKSISAMKSIGCTIEGILRSNGYCADGTRRDSIILSILNNEWFSDIKSSLQKKISI